MMHIKSLINKIFYPRPEVVLGVDIGFDRVKVVQLNMKGRGMPEVTDYVLADLPQELRGTGLTTNTEDIANFLSDLIKKHGFGAKDCVFSIGGRNAFVREITMPPMSEEEMQQAITWDSAQYVPYEADTYYVDFAVFGELNEEGQQPVILVASPKDVVDALLDVGEALELNILKLDIDVLSWYRTMPDKYSDFILLHLGRTYSLMTIFQKGAPVAQRSIQTGGLTFGKIIAENMHVSISDAMEILRTENLLQSKAVEKEPVREALLGAVSELIKECRRTGDYYILNKKEASFTHLVLVGSGASLVGMPEIMDEQLDIKVERFNILKVVNFDSRFEKNKVQANAASLGVAIGAAMAGGAEDD
ncbi:hypothetical protein SDC9_36931 [bioreactor metagenome]|uniref:SHS2 domain-containing protein n=1 Tax=bioreactor metagenome TaxID=1076179 RepID=A0A644VJU7_9ZZZZ|nr:type IV pilus assembly protein PilM [Acidaminococcaceae bacterium]